MIWNCLGTEELKQVAREVLQRADGFTEDSAFVVGLVGDLGSGKTTFMKNLAAEVGIKEDVTSPTFVLQKRFEIPNPSQNTISNPNNIIFVEWADLISESLPPHTLKMKFSVVDEKTRKIEIPDA
jgi:tRNA threonylcarbamoyladenosine biosynthesis protein TsaE